MICQTCLDNRRSNPHRGAPCPVDCACECHGPDRASSTLQELLRDVSTELSIRGDWTADMGWRVTLTSGMHLVAQAYARDLDVALELALRRLELPETEVSPAKHQRYINDDGDKVRVDHVANGEVYFVSWRNGESWPLYVPKRMTLELFAELLEKHGMRVHEP